MRQPIQRLGLDSAIVQLTLGPHGLFVFALPLSFSFLFFFFSSTFPVFFKSFSRGSWGCRGGGVEREWGMVLIYLERPERFRFFLRFVILSINKQRPPSCIDR